MPTFHWLFASYDTVRTPSSNLPNCDIVIPPNATMKRFLVAETNFAGTNSGFDVNVINTMYVRFSVDIVAGQYAGRNLYLTKYRIPSMITGFHDVLTAQRVYTNWAQANDRELGINEKCSFGTNPGPGFTVRLTSSLFALPGALGFPSMRCTAVFRALYSLP